MNLPPLRIAMVAPPWFELPPPAYGGIESMCTTLVESLVAKGHDVSLVATGRSGTRARFYATLEKAQAHRIGQSLPDILHTASVEAILKELDLDLVHDHTLPGPLFGAGRRVPTVVTAHGPITDEMSGYYGSLSPSMHLVAISDAQRRSAPALHWAGMVHNGIPTAEFPFRAEKEDFALFLGRVGRDKGLSLAISAATAARVRLVIGAKCREPDEVEDFKRNIEPRLTTGVEWLGEVDHATKLELLAAARCLLFPIQWEEPFGMVMIESLACGTPVVAMRRGSVPEVLTDGVTGLICDEPSELIEALHEIDHLDPAECRREARLRFDAGLMAKGYEAIYRDVVHRHGALSETAQPDVPSLPSLRRRPGWGAHGV